MAPHKSGESLILTTDWESWFLSIWVSPCDLLVWASLDSSTFYWLVWKLSIQGKARQQHFPLWLGIEVIQWHYTTHCWSSQLQKFTYFSVERSINGQWVIIEKTSEMGKKWIWKTQSAAESIRKSFFCIKLRMCACEDTTSFICTYQAWKQLFSSDFDCQSFSSLPLGIK